ncbi:MAG TPA: hypothetical protein VEA37_05665, partial [Flavobacterium sp.]|nr:hypothetical protein [Flavobacterium sp.]
MVTKLKPQAKYGVAEQGPDDPCKNGKRVINKIKVEPCCTEGPHLMSRNEPVFAHKSTDKLAVS